MHILCGLGFIRIKVYVYEYLHILHHISLCRIMSSYLHIVIIQYNSNIEADSFVGLFVGPLHTLLNSLIRQFRNDAKFFISEANKYSDICGMLIGLQLAIQWLRWHSITGYHGEYCITIKCTLSSGKNTYVLQKWDISPNWLSTLRNPSIFKCS